MVTASRLVGPATWLTCAVNCIFINSVLRAPRVPKKLLILTRVPVESLARRVGEGTGYAAGTLHTQSDGGGLTTETLFIQNTVQ